MIESCLVQKKAFWLEDFGRELTSSKTILPLKLFKSPIIGVTELQLDH